MVEFYMLFSSLSDPGVIRGIAGASSVAGSALLAWRVKGILEALAFVASIHESNIEQITSNLSYVVIGENATKHVEKAQRYGLLITGFILLGLGGALNVLAAFIGQ